MMLCDVDRLSSTDCSTASREFDQWSWEYRAEGEILRAFCRLTLVAWPLPFFCLYARACWDRASRDSAGKGHVFSQMSGEQSKVTIKRPGSGTLLFVFLFF